MHFERCFRYFFNAKTVRWPFLGDIGVVEKLRIFHHFREFCIFALASLNLNLNLERQNIKMGRKTYEDSYAWSNNFTLTVKQSYTLWYA